jgi:diguanylate cyclase
MSDDDLLAFMEETPLHPAHQRYWRILVVDDDPDVHEATKLALSGLSIVQRPLQFLHAYSGKEALDILAVENEIAVILLDVVMESERAGLDLVHQIRNQLKLTIPRIILRTGQPGYAPELDAIRDYDINDYKTKNELTRTKLFAALTAALRSYDQIQRLEISRRGLEQIVAASGTLLRESGVEAFSRGVILQLAALLGVDADGVVCAQAGCNLEDMTIIAAAGRFAPLYRRRLEELEDERIRELLRTCLEQKRHMHGEDALTLYFSSQQSRGFAVFVDTQNKLADVDCHLLEVFCSNIATCGDNIVLLSKLHEAAYTDALVDLPNRAAMIEKLEKRQNKPAPHKELLVAIDIDQFTQINDVFGYHYGDQLLQALARRLKQHFGNNLARVANNCFAWLGAAHEFDLNKLQQCLLPALELDGVQHSLEASIGIVELDTAPPNGRDVLREASLAIKRARTPGYHKVCHYNEAIGAETRERLLLLQNLRRAFEHDRLSILFQPRVDLENQRIIACEAFLEWQDDRGHHIPATDFLPLAQQAGLLIPLEIWLLRSALHALSLLRKNCPGMRLSINLSQAHLERPDMPDTISTALLDSGIEAHGLELEIPAHLSSQAPTAVLHNLEQLRTLGVGITLDHFDLASSSMACLECLALDRVKLAPSFLQALNESGRGFHIAETVLRLVQSLGLRVAAQGVQNREEQKHLIELGCHEAQGNDLCPALPATEVQTWLEKRQKSL